MKRITKEQLRDIMTQWVEYSKHVSGVTEQVLGEIERAFVTGNVCGMLGVKFGELHFDNMPPIVQMCWMSGRPLSSVVQTGNEESVRLNGAPWVKAMARSSGKAPKKFCQDSPAMKACGME